MNVSLTIATVVSAAFVFGLVNKAGRLALDPEQTVMLSQPEPVSTQWAHAEPTPEGIFAVSFAPRGRVRQSLFTIAGHSESESDLLVLQLRGVELPRRPPVGGLVFLLRPGAPLPTSPNDPRFLGALGLGSDEEGDAPFEYVTELNVTVRRLIAAGAFSPEHPLTVGIVGVTDDIPTEIRPIRFRDAVLSAKP